MATYIIGDVQGCHDPLHRLLELISFDPARDYLWFTGDLVNRGGQSLEVLRLVHSLRKRVVSVLGNHDLHLLGSTLHTPSASVANPEFRAVADAPDGAALLQWLSKRPFMHRDKTRGMLMVHAGLLPAWTIPQARLYAREAQKALRGPKQKKFLNIIYGNYPDTWSEDLKYWQRVKLTVNIFTRIRFCNAVNRLNFKANGPPEQAPRGHLPWYMHATARNPKWTVVYGHWAAAGLLITPKLIGLDTGCVWGGKLTAMRLEDREIFQVPGI